MNLLQRLLSWLLGSRAEIPARMPARMEPRPPDGAGRGSPDPAQEPDRRSPDPIALAPSAAPEWREFRPEPPPVAKKVGRSLGLDAADYLPITRAEIKEAARGRSLLSNPWFGRRD